MREHTPKTTILTENRLGNVSYIKISKEHQANISHQLPTTCHMIAANPLAMLLSF